MSSKQKKFRGVRQRHWGSWVSEIRHPLLKTRIWLGTFETADDAARAYDEAAWLMSGPAARTNFPLDDDDPAKGAGSGSYLSPALRAKLEKCCRIGPLPPPPAQDGSATAGGRQQASGGAPGYDEATATATATANNGDDDEVGEEYIEEMIKELTCSSCRQQHKEHNIRSSTKYWLHDDNILSVHG
ncbi:hypothetical protein GUJ93_ZPchr0004g38857 [Zizania palustris]|uniref:AP2/ERF domain-containing protein n=1 Tax=Zizania palustris TaxID=103762 RepID=A0A8J5VZN4_ZIZPA|nr:hypothetical protein GUJ93_ZPchr0004g38857 [Zizania palustris]